MIDIVGNIKIDESKPERIAYLVASIRSLHFMNERGRGFILNLCSPSQELFDLISKELSEFTFSRITRSPDELDYGTVYSSLLGHVRNPFVLNFLEDHFTVMENPGHLQEILECMNRLQVDVLKCSFHKIEKLSSTRISGNCSTAGKAFINSMAAHSIYCQHYGNRFYIGVNFITSLSFANKFWNRKLGTRPHDYEISGFDFNWQHTCMIPSQEIQCAIDDDHGEPGTCLLKRQEPKWLRIYEEVCRELGLQLNSELPTPNSSLS